jgi:predicted amidohydrolase
MEKSISLIQMKIIPGEPEINRNTAIRLIRAAMKNRPDIIVLPEMWTTAYKLQSIKDYCDKNGQPTLSILKELSVHNNVNIVCGSFANMKNNHVYNTAYVINRLGNIVGEYNKIHLFKLMKEDEHITHGNSVCVFELDGIKCGIIICYDLRFPELARKLTLMGIELLFVPAQWPKARRDHWVTLLRARAIENQIYVVAVNCAGASEESEFAGSSMIINPWGEIVIETDYREQIAKATIDLQKIKQVKSKLDSIRDRVPEIY